MGYIPPQALDNLKKYNYKSVDKSIVSKYFLNPFWNQAIKLFPRWVAPNVITLTGLVTVAFNILQMLYYDPLYLTPKGGAAGPPQWIYFMWGACLFIYQSLDGMDGKQARRTGMASPLGELFDHGCDAINTTLEVVLASYALNLGRSWWTVASQAATLANFYLTTWEEYYTGQLYLGIFSGPVEGILLIITIYVVTGFYGTSFWDNGFLTLLGLDQYKFISQNVPNTALNECFMIFGAFGLAINIITSYMNVYTSRLQVKKSPYQPLWYLLPFLFDVTLNVSWLARPSVTESAILHSSLFIPFLGAWGLQFAHQVGRMILAHVTSTPMPWFDSLWLLSLIGTIDANLPILIGRQPIIQSTPFGVSAMTYFYLFASFASYARFCYMVIQDITNHLGIACFTVRKRDEHGHWKEAPAVNSKKTA